MIIRFGAYELDEDAFELRHDGKAVVVEPQVFEVIAYLVRHRDRLVTKEELLDEVWGTRFVTESTLTTRIKGARRALGDDGQRQEVIRTVHGRGYRFVASVSAAATAATSPAGSSAGGSATGEQRISFCRAPDGARLAYATHGDGPVLVKAANWLTHLDHDWNSPVWQHWLTALGARHRVIRYDERGSGLSDLDADDYSMDAWVADLGAVVDDAGLDRFPLLGISQGAAVAIAYAVANPERVTKLVLFGSYAVGWLGGRSPERHRDRATAMIELARVGWGARQPAFRQLFTSSFLPGGDPGDWAAFDELQRTTTTPENAARFLDAFFRLDVSDLAERVSVPTLVLHCRGDQVWPFEQGRQLAARIPGSRFVPLDSENHLLLEREPAWQQFLSELDRFLPDTLPISG
jgi:pimeloyl-ACP methyl ester carboxylesterase/DNA-binding winged helix-turn-helix (wHTH) protein